MRRLFIALALVFACVPACAQVGLIGTQVPKASGAPPAPAPTDPSGPSPSNGATGLSLSVTLSWAGCSTATAYGVKYGGSNPPATDSGALGSASFSLTGLANSTTYYWQPYCSNASGDNPSKATPAPVYSFTTLAGAPAGVLSQANLSIAGCFVTYGVTTGSNWGTDYPVTFYRSGGVRHYLQMSGGRQYGDLFESIEPTLKPCSTAIGSLNLSTLVGAIGWTLPDVNGSTNTPGNGGVVRGIYLDQTTNRFYLGWSGQYTNLPDGINTFAIYDMDTTAKTATLRGCYALPHPMPYTSGGVVPIPASFIATYGLPAGARWGLLGGLFASATSGNLYGPSIEAIVPPTDAPGCSTTDNLISSGTVLARFVANTSGPSCCGGGGSGTPNLGCSNPSPAPTSPNHAYLSFNNYSYCLYSNDWEAYGTPNKVGYYNDYVGWRVGWYDDGVKTGGVVPFTASEGWLSATISASPAPTMTGDGSVGSTGTMRISSTSTNEITGPVLHANVGDFLGVQMCVRDVDAGCTSENQKWLGIGRLTAVNTSTGDVTFTVVKPTGCTSCSQNIPIVGGGVYGGPVYVSAIPGWMRSTLRMQIINPASWGAVVGGAAQYSPTYTEEFSLYDMGVTTLGDPSAGGGIQAGFDVGSAQNVTSVVTDAVAQQIVVFVHNVVNGGGIERSLGIVFNVSHTP